MSRTVYVNGAYVAEESAHISVFDRGFLFADAVYEVSAVVNGQLVDNAAHLARLQRSCRQLQLSLPYSLAEIVEIQQQLIVRNQLREGAVYLQLTRGNAGDRDFGFPPASVAPSLVLFTQQRRLLLHPKADVGLNIITVPDIRWGRRDIKTVGLLAACMAKTAAQTQGADDAWLVQDGFVTEGSSCNAYIVTQAGVIVTRPLSEDILHGITRRAILQLAHEQGVTIEERPFSIDDALAAREAFITSATTFLLPVVSIDGQRIGNGTPGPIAQRLRQIYIAMVQANPDR